MSNNKLALTLSKDEIQKNDIEVKINQNDLIDLIVRQKIEEIDSLIEFTTINANNIIEKIKKFYNEQEEKIKETILKKNKDFKILRFSYFTNNGLTGLKDGSIESLDFLYKNNNGSSFLVCFAQTTNSIGQNRDDKNYYIAVKPFALTARVFIAYNNQGIDFRGHVDIVLEKFVLPKEIIKLIKEHNKNVNKIHLELGKEKISESDISKKIKAEFTKGLLKNMDKSLIQKINDQFNLSL